MPIHQFQQPRKRCRVLAMICGSLVFHCALVGTAALWHQEDPAPQTGTKIVTVEISDPPRSEATVPAPLLSLGEPIPRPAQEFPVPEPAPETMPEQEIVDPVSPKPLPPKMALRPLSPALRAAATNRPQTTAGSPGAVGGPGTGRSVSTTPGSSLQGWHVTMPVYPYEARKYRLEGIGRVRVATDAMGHVSEVTILRSTGNSVLDANTLSHIRAEWSGPPNASIVREVQYRLQ